MAAALAVVAHAPRAARPALESLAFDAFHSGLQVACLAGAGVAVLGALRRVGSCQDGVHPRCSRWPMLRLVRVWCWVWL